MCRVEIHRTQNCYWNDILTLEVESVWIAVEGINRDTSAAGTGVALIAIDPGCVAGLAAGAYRQRVARERETRAKKIIGIGVRRFNISLLSF